MCRTGGGQGRAFLQGEIAGATAVESFEQLDHDLSIDSVLGGWSSHRMEAALRTTFCTPLVGAAPNTASAEMVSRPGKPTT